MSLITGGLKSILQSATSTVAQLAGQAVSMLSLTLTQTTGNVALQMTTGARLKLGGGTNDFMTSDGTNTLVFAGAALVTSGLQAASYTVGTTGGVLTRDNVNTADMEYNSRVANGASAVAHAFGNQNALSTAGAQIAAFYQDSLSTKVLAIDQAGRLLNPSPGNSTGTPGNATLNTASGRCSMNAGAGATLVISNSLVSTSTIPIVTIMTADATMTAVKSAVPTASTLTITFNAASTGTVVIGWLLWNV